MKRRQLVYVDGGYFCCGITIETSDDGKSATVVEAAPIMKWSVGKDWATVSRWISKRGTFTYVTKED